MKKYLLVLVSLCCALLPALAEHPEYPELRKSDANIIGHILDKKTNEHLPYYSSTERDYYRNGNGCYRTLFSEKLAGGEFCTGNQFGRI